MHELDTGPLIAGKTNEAHGTLIRDLGADDHDADANEEVMAAEHAGG